MTLSDVEVARLRVAVGEEPKPVWTEWFCSRCDHPFKTRNLIAMLCPPCSIPALKAGLQPLQGVMSGS